MCVSRSLMFRLETKMPWRQTPSSKKKAVVALFKVRGIESLKYVREFYTPVCYCGDISTPQNVTLNEMNCDWLFNMLVKRLNGRALANESCHGFQTFSHQSEGLATRDYHVHHLSCKAAGIYDIIKLNFFTEMKTRTT